MRAISRSVAVWAECRRSSTAQVVQLDRRPEDDPQRPEREQLVGAGHRCRHERHPGLERDPGRTRACPGLVLLDEPLLAPRSLGEHDDDLALAGKPDGRLHRLHVSDAAPDLESTCCVQHRRSGHQ